MIRSSMIGTKDKALYVHRNIRLDALNLVFVFKALMVPVMLLVINLCFPKTTNGYLEFGRSPQLI